MMNSLLKKIMKKQARIGVIGLGYVGLPLAIEFANAGFRVIGIDYSREKVNSLNRGRSYVLDVKDAELKKVLKTKRFQATSDYSEARQLDAVCICVPTPLRKTKDPDVSYIEVAVKQLSDNLKKGALIVLESTTYPGTTEELILPMLKERGGEVGKDFYLAFSPERVDPSNKKFKITNTPKVVGGVTKLCRELAIALYGQIIEQIVPVSSVRSAEMVKLLENTFRSVNIAMVNELMIMSERMGLDIWEVIDAAATKPFGFVPFYPGPGIGGHCIPVDPTYLSWKAKSFNFYTRFIDLATEINSNMPRYVVNRIAEALNTQGKSLKGAKLLLLGIAYKKDVNDVRESPALEIIAQLQKQEARVLYHDPFVPSLDGAHGLSGKLNSSALTDKLLEGVDCAVVLTDHSVFNYRRILEKVPMLVDTRNATKSILKGMKKIIKL